jgi:hypothetical protein
LQKRPKATKKTRKLKTNIRAGEGMSVTDRRDISIILNDNAGNEIRKRTN